MNHDILGIGLTGESLTDLERRILSENTPCGVVLFGRNVGGVRQLRELVAEIKSLAPGKPPLFMIDEEGGRVDRLRRILPGLPSAEAFGEGDRPVELAQWFGKVIGMALRYFDIEVNLAPVIDIHGAVAGPGLERRMFGRNPETVVELAGAFIHGMQEAGVASCLKHWPGIGEGSGDSHYGDTVIKASLDEMMERELVPFMRLGNDAGAIMIGHGLYPRLSEGPALPASLSRHLTTDLLRETVGFEGLAMSDDMEMHAVSDLGSYENIAERALTAGCDVILFCSHLERIPDLQRYLARRVMEDPAVRARFETASTRTNTFRAFCDRLRAQSSPPATWEEVVDETSRFIEEFERTRPHREVIIPDSERRKSSRNPRTGREEWT